MDFHTVYRGCNFRFLDLKYPNSLWETERPETYFVKHDIEIHSVHVNRTLLWALKTLLCSDLPGWWFTIKEIVIQTNNLFSGSASINTLWALSPMWVAYEADKVLILPAKSCYSASNFKQWLLTEGFSFAEILINDGSALFSSWLTIKLFTKCFYKPTLKKLHFELYWNGGRWCRSQWGK